MANIVDTPNKEINSGADDHDKLFDGQGIGENLYAPMWDDSSHDQMWDGNSSNKINDGEEHNILLGSSHNSWISGDTTHDKLWGGADNDQIQDDDSDDWISETSGNDVAAGGPSHDWMSKDEEHNALYGENNTDRSYDGSESDVLKDDFENDDLNDHRDHGSPHGAVGDDTDLFRAETKAFDEDKDTLKVIHDTDLTHFSDILENIEIIDLQSSKTTLNKSTVDSITDHDNELFVNGESSSEVTLDGVWVESGNVVVDGSTYTVYTSGHTTVNIEENVVVHA